MPMLTKMKMTKAMVPGNNAENDGDGNGGTQGAVDTVSKIAMPKMYRVLLINDDFTPMDFVVAVLKRFFSKNEDQATNIMLDVHQKGVGTAGVFILEIAEMKVMQVNQFARLNEHPLKCTLEQE